MLNLKWPGARLTRRNENDIFLFLQVYSIFDGPKVLDTCQPSNEKAKKPFPSSYLKYFV